MSAASRWRRRVAAVAPAPEPEIAAKRALPVSKLCRGAAVVVRAEEGKKGGFFGAWLRLGRHVPPLMQGCAAL